MQHRRGKERERGVKDIARDHTDNPRRAISTSSSLVITKLLYNYVFVKMWSITFITNICDRNRILLGCTCCFLLKKELQGHGLWLIIVSDILSEPRILCLWEGEKFNIMKFLSHVGVTQYISFPSAWYICMLYAVSVKKLCIPTAAWIHFFPFQLKELYSDAQSLAILQ